MKSVVMATHFHLTSVHPKWARKMKFVKKIGNIYFTWRNNERRTETTGARFLGE